MASSRICCGVLLGFDFSGGSLEGFLIPAQIGHADFEQFVQRQIDHFFVQQLLAIEVRAQPKVAMRAGQNIIFEEVLILRQKFDRNIVGLVEFGQQFCVRNLFEGGGNVVFEKADDARQLLDRDLGVNTRRVPEIGAGGSEYGWELAFARDHGLQAVRRQARTSGS